jgi:hypothetical protein
MSCKFRDVLTPDSESQIVSLIRRQLKHVAVLDGRLTLASSNPGYGHSDFMKPVLSSSSMKLVSKNSSALRPFALGLLSAMRLKEFSTPLGLTFGIFLM